MTYAVICDASRATRSVGRRGYSRWLFGVLVSTLLWAMPTACSQRQVCEETIGSCLDLIVEGPAEIERLRIDAALGSATPPGSRVGILSLSTKLPRHILVTPPPGAAADALRALTVTGYSSEDLTYVADELPLVWPEGEHITARVTLPAATLAPQIDKIEPALGSSIGGQMVTISGRNFARAVEVQINGAAAALVNRISSTEIRAATPAQPGTLGGVDLAVTNLSSGQRTIRSKAYSYFLGTLDIPTASTVPVGIQPCGMVNGDFNKDGLVDLAVANSGSNSITILRGKGDGTFSQTLEISGPNTYLNGPCSIIATDLNKDGNLDLVTGNTRASHISAFMGSSTGVFNINGSTFGTESGPTSLASADFNGDGNVDLAVANSGTGPTSVSIMQGDGIGGLVTIVNYDVTMNAKEVVVGDFNGDTKPDIMALVGSGATMALGYGRNTTSGTTFSMAAVSIIALGSAYQGMSILDADADGDLDIALSSSSNGFIILRRGNGAGAFAAPESFRSCNFSSATIAADVNKDGRTDIVSLCYSSHAVSIHNSNSNGTFSNSSDPGFLSYMTDLGPRCAVSEDVNRDGVNDLLICNNGNANISIILGESNGRFRGGSQIPLFASIQPFIVDVGDINGDGIPDLLTGTDDVSSRTMLALGAGGGSFAPIQTIRMGAGRMWLALGDLNGGGTADLAMRTGTSNDVYIGLGDGNGGFSNRPTVTGPNPVGQLLLRDVNGDGMLDLMMLAEAQNRAITTRFGNGDGTFQNGIDDSPISVNGPVYFATGDLNKDGKLDYALIDRPDNKVLIRLGDGAAGFVAGPTLTTNTGPNTVAIADCNGDGFQDVVVSHALDNSLLWFMGSATGLSSSNQRQVNVLAPQSHVTTADMDGDRVIDLLVTQGATNKVLLLRGRGDGTFEAARSMITPRDPSWSTVADLDGDGRLDFVTANRADHTLSVFFNRSR